MAAASIQIRAAAELELRRRKANTYTVVGLVCPTKGHTHSLSNKSGQWLVTQDKPSVFIPLIMEKVLTSTKRFIVLVGGRGSGKSISAADICLIDAKDSGSKTYFLREFQSSIKNSVHSLLRDEINRLEFEGFDSQAQTIKYKGDDSFEFAGLSRNIASIKSSHGFKRYSVEEAQFLSEESIKELTPTARNKPNKGLPMSADQLKQKSEDGTLSTVSMIFVANPQSSEDPFSKRFITPFISELDEFGIYEDDLHLIIKVNYDSNPWYVESGLEQERRWAYDNLDRSLADHIWLGMFNDSVEGSLITAQEFEACIDAHIKLGFEPRGAKIAGFDPADTGEDSKAYVLRHGSVVLDIQETYDGDVNSSGHWAAGRAIQHGADHFIFDSVGVGAALKEQISQDFGGKPIKIQMFNGAETPQAPDAIYNPAKQATIINQRTNKDTFRNRRVQNYCLLRDRIYRTYRAVEHGEYMNPDEMISFDSNMKFLSKLKSELCKMPVKPNGNGLVDLYTKQEMKSKFGFASPNLADALCFTLSHVMDSNVQVRLPKPIKAMGLGR